MKLADFSQIIFADSCLAKLVIPTVRYGISTNPIIKYIFVFFQVLPFNKNMLDNWVGDTIYPLPPHLSIFAKIIYMKGLS